MVSLPEPPMAFSIVAPKAIAMLLVRGPMDENSPSPSLIVWLVMKPLASIVSMPPASQIAKTGFGFCAKSYGLSANPSIIRPALELKP